MEFLWISSQVCLCRFFLGRFEAVLAVSRQCHVLRFRWPWCSRKNLGIQPSQKWMKKCWAIFNVWLGHMCIYIYICICSLVRKVENHYYYYKTWMIRFLCPLTPPILSAIPTGSYRFWFGDWTVITNLSACLTNVAGPILVPINLQRPLWNLIFFSPKTWGPLEDDAIIFWMHLLRSYS